VDTYYDYDIESPFPSEEFKRLRIEMDWARRKYHEPNESFSEHQSIHDMWTDRLSRLVMMARHNELLEMRQEKEREGPDV